MTMTVTMLRSRFVGGVLLAKDSSQTLSDADGGYLVNRGWATRTDGVPDRPIAGSNDVAAIGDAGELINPAAGNAPVAGQVFHVFGGLGRIRVRNTGDASETFTLTYHLRDGSTETASETLAAGYDEDWQINTANLDHLTWASTGAGASVETY